mgnify:CR=1 FL=1
MEIFHQISANPSNKRKQRVLGVSLGPELYDEVRRLCAARLKTPSEWARGLVEVELERIKREENMT